MIKKFVYYGIALIIIAVIVVLATGALLTSGIGKVLTEYNVTAYPHSFAEVAIPSNALNFSIYVFSSNQTNFYVLNNSAFSQWNSYMSANKNASGLVEVRTLNVNNNDIFVNNVSGEIPVLSQVSKQLYVVIDNTAGSKSTPMTVNAVVSYLPLEAKGLILYLIVGVLGFIIGISGIIVAIYGVFKKNPVDMPGPEGTASPAQTAKQQKDKEYVDQLYKGVDKKKKKKSAKSKSASG